VAWTVGETDHAAIHVARSTDGKTFSKPTVVEASARGYSDAPKLALDADGRLHLAFARTRGGPFEPAEVRYTRSRDGTTFEPTRLISQPFASGIAGSFPSLAVEGNRVVITWDYSPKADQPPHGIGIAYSADDGARFTRPALIEGTQDAGPNGGFEGRLMRKLAVRGDTIAVVNSAKRAGESSRVWMLRGSIGRG
jgi:hypothetical protein